MALEAPGPRGLGWSLPLPLSEGAHGPEGWSWDSSAFQKQ